MAGTLTIDTLKASSGVLATQNGMTGIAKAWVQFSGATPTINGQFNVSSITRNGTGDYTINFTTAMPNANYAPIGIADGNSGDTGAVVVETTRTVAPTASAYRFLTKITNVAGTFDSTYISVAVFSS